MFHIGYDSTPHYAFIFIEKVSFSKDVNVPVYIRVERIKSTSGIMRRAFHSETRFQLADSNNIVQFNNEFQIPVTIFSKKGEKPQKKLVEISCIVVGSSKASEHTVCTWRFDAANLPNPKDSSIQTSQTKCEFGVATLYLRFILCPEQDYPNGPPQNYFSFVTAKTESPEIKNTLNDPDPTDLTSQDGESQAVDTLEPTKKKKHHKNKGKDGEKKHHHHKNKLDNKGEKKKHRKSAANVDDLEKQNLKHHKSKDEYADNKNNTTSNQDENPQGEKHIKPAKSADIITLQQNLSKNGESPSHLISPDNQFGDSTIENLQSDEIIIEEEFKEDNVQYAAREEVDMENTTKEDFPYSIVKPESPEETATRIEFLKKIQEVYDVHDDKLQNIAMKFCGTELSYLSFKYFAFPANRNTNFTDLIIEPLKKYRIFEFGNISDEKITEMFEPVLLSIKYAVNTDNGLDGSLGLLSTMINFGIELHMIAGPYTSAHFPVIHKIEEYISKIMNILMQKLFSNFGTCIICDGENITFDQESNIQLKETSAIFKESITKFNIPEEVVQSIVVSCANYFANIVFNVLVSTCNKFKSDNIVSLLQKLREIQGLFVCLPSNFPEAFGSILRLITIVQSLEGGTTLQRMKVDAQLWRSVAERMEHPVLPDGVSFDDISPPIERNDLKVPVKQMDIQFTFEWLFTASATNNYDEDDNSESEDENQ